MPRIGPYVQGESATIRIPGDPGPRLHVYAPDGVETIYPALRGFALVHLTKSGAWRYEWEGAEVEGDIVVVPHQPKPRAVDVSALPPMSILSRPDR